MLVRRARQSSAHHHGIAVVLLLFAVAGPVPAFAVAPNLHQSGMAKGALSVANLPPPPSPSQYIISMNCTLVTPGWCLSPMVVTLNYTGSSTNAYFEYSVDGSPWQTYTAPFRICGEGPHFFNVTLYEGRQQGASLSAAFSIDSFAPLSVLDLGGDQPVDGWYNASPVARLSGSDNNSGLAGLQYRIDNGTWANYTSGVSLPDGVYPFDYRARDVAGNVEPYHRQLFRVDTHAPVLYSLSASVFHANQGQVEWHAVDSLSGVAGYAVSVDGGPFVGVGTQEAFSFSLPDGSHEIQVRATDAVGNAVVLSIPIRIDTNPFSYTGPFGATLTFLLLLVATLLVWFAYSRQMRRLGRS